MKRGFLRSGKKSAPKRTPPSSDMSDATVTQEPCIKAERDDTCVVQSDPLILQCEKNPPGLYFGYFPPGSKAPETVIIHPSLDVLKAAANWPAWKTQQNASPSAATVPAFEVVSIPGKGLGMVAKRDIVMGELIHKERPIYVAAQFMLVSGQQRRYFRQTALSKLGRPQQEALMALSNAYSLQEKDLIAGIISTNSDKAFLVPKPDHERVTACFPTLARINHSCVPNADYVFHFSDFTGRYYATRNVRAGEEITACYCDPLEPSQMRKEELFTRYRFHCKCEACDGSTAPAGKLSKSDENRLYIKQNLPATLPINDPRLLDQFKKAIQLAEFEQLADAKAKVLFRGATYLLLRAQAGETQYANMATEWIALSREINRKICGEGHHTMDPYDRLVDAARLVQALMEGK